MNDSAAQTRRPKAENTLWVITEPYYPEETSTGYYLTQIAEGLADKLIVKVICSQPNYSARDKTAPAREKHGGVEIFRAGGTRLDKNVIPFRLVNMITNGFAVFLTAVRRVQSGDMLLVVTTPPSLPFVAAAAALVRGAAYTLLIHDNYPEILIAAKKTKPDSLIVRLNQFANRWLYKYASRIIVVGRDMEELIRRKTSGLDIPVTTIQNWGENDDVVPLPKAENALLKELGLIDKFVFLYAGNMGHPNDIESIVIAADTLADERPDIHFLFLGAGAKRKWLEKRIAASGVNNITLLDPRPRSEQINFLNACHVTIVSLVSRMLGVSMPSRTYNALAAGKPLLALTEPRSEVALTIEDDNVGWIVPPEDPRRLVETILKIYDRRADLPTMSARARSAAEKRFSQDTAIAHYREIFVGREIEPISQLGADIIAARENAQS